MNEKKREVKFNCGCPGCIGSIVAVALSWIANKSILWCVLHFFCSWLYVAYWVLFRSAAYDWLVSICR
jgi:hypothetical protein